MNVFIVAYDVADDRRRTEVSAVCCGYGERIQYSVFRCVLSKTMTVEITARLHDLIHHDKDRILIIDLGPRDGRGGQCISAFGLALHVAGDEPPVF